MTSQITLSRILVFFISVIFIWIFFISVWYSRNILDSNTFVSKTTQILQSEQVRNSISNEVLERAAQRRPILGRVTQPILSKVVSGVLASDLFSNAYERIARELHLQLTSKDPRQISVNVSPAKNFVVLLTRDEDPQLVTNIPDEIILIRKNQIPSLYKFGTTLSILGPVLLIIGLILLVDLWRKFENKRTYIVILGLVFAASGFIVYGLVPAIGNYIAAHSDSANVANIIRQVYFEFTYSVSRWATYVFFAGIISAVSAQFLKPGIFRIPGKKNK